MVVYQETIESRQLATKSPLTMERLAPDRLAEADELDKVEKDKQSS